MDTASIVRQLGGIASTASLAAAGLSDYRVRSAVRAGVVVRVRNGWVTTLSATEPRVQAVRAGGLLTGISALRELGAWVLDPPPCVHIAVPAHASGRRARPDQLLHWENPTAPPSRPGVAALGDALVRLALDESLDVAVPCFDWALFTARLDRVDFERILLRLPPSLRTIRAHIDRNSQSLLESIARVRLHARGWQVRSQVRVGVDSAIDLVVEDHVALELDGRAFHESTFETDRRKDLAITMEGRHAIRVSMTMLRDSWGDVEAAIGCALAARRHGDRGNSGELTPVLRAKLRARRLRR